MHFLQIYIIVLLEDKMITKSQIKAKIMEAIKSSDKSQRQIAKELGVSTKTVWKYANGHSLPKLNRLGQLCAILNLDSNEILCLN